MTAPKYQSKHWLGLPTDFFKNNAEFAHKNESVYGNFFWIQLLMRRLYVIAHPTVIRHVLQVNPENYPKSPAYHELKLALGEGLVTSEGALWRHQRKLIQPTFYKKQLKSLYASMGEVVQQYMTKLQHRIKENNTVNIHTEMMTITADVVLKTLFSTERAHQEEVFQNMLEMQEYVIHRITHPLQTPLHRINGNHKKFKRNAQQFNQMIYQLIDERRSRQDRPNDLLSMLLATTLEDSNEGMSDQQLRDELITLYSAGHDTSANALSWTLYLLAKHPDCIEKIRAEVNKLVAGEIPTFEELKNLQYTRQVIEEGMRLFPPAHVVGRYAKETDEILGNTIPKNSIMYISIFALHRSEAYWDEPLVFDPDRFSPAAVKARPKLVYMPFGAGARMCIGNHFAMMEMQLILTQLVRLFNFQLLPNQTIETHPLITLKPRAGIQMKLTLVEKQERSLKV